MCVLLLFLSRINNYLLIFNHHTIFILDKRILFALYCSYLVIRIKKNKDKDKKNRKLIINLDIRFSTSNKESERLFLSKKKK